MTNPEDRLFAKYKLTGSPRALGRVYDLVAPELFDVAKHLAGDPLDAEDLVQRTFVTAIERASTFRDEERLMPWLVGILANHAKSEFRKRQRTPDPMRLELRKQLLPDGEAQAAELDEYLDRALEALPEEQRSVLTLRLRHQLSAAQIADALSKPPGTVRSQLARGLERLRENMPAGLAGAAAILFGLPQGLSVVRAAVLREAGRASLPKLAIAKGYMLWTLAPVAEILVMKKLALAAVVLIGSLVGVRVATQGDLAPEPPALELTSGNLPQVSEVQPDAKPQELATRKREALDEPPGEIRSAQPSAANAVAAPQTFGKLLINVRDAFGAPAVDETCIVSRSGQTMDVNEARIVRTGGSGAVLLEEVAVGSVLVRPLRGKSRYVSINPGQTASVTFELESALTVSGQVVDADDLPIPYADIWLSDRSNSKQGYPITRTDAAGEFSLTSITSKHYIGAFAQGYGMSYLQAPRGIAEDRAQMKIVLSEAGATVKVEVVDPKGRAIEGATVLIGDEGSRAYRRLADGSSGPPAPPRRGRSDQSGVTNLESVPLGPAPVLVRKSGWGLGREQVEVFADRTNSLRVQLQPEARLIGQVVNQDEQAVPGAEVWTGTQYRFESSSALTDREGRFELVGLPAGELEVRARRRGLGDTLEKLSFVSGEVLETTLVLEERPQIHGQLLDAQGRALLGYNVVAREEQSGKHTGPTSVGLGGRFTIVVEPEVRYSVVVHRPGDWTGFPLLVEPGLQASSDSITLRLPQVDTETATIRLRALAPDGTPAAGSQIDLWHEELKIWRSFETQDELGNFDLSRLAPGTIKLTLRHSDHPVKTIEKQVLEAGELIDLGDQTFEASGRLHGHFVGNFEVERLADLQIYLGKVGGGYGVVELTGRNFKSSPLAPGKHTFSVVGDFFVPVYRRVDVIPGEDIEIEIELLPAGLRLVHIEVREGEEPPVWIGANAKTLEGRFTWSGAAKKLEDGRFEARVSVPPGSYLFEANDNYGRKASLQLDVLDMRGEQPPLKLRLGAMPN